MNKLSLTLAALCTTLGAALSFTLWSLLMTNDTLTSGEFLSVTAGLALCAGGVIGGAALFLAEVLSRYTR